MPDPDLPVLPTGGVAHYYLSVSTDGTVTDVGEAVPGAEVPAGVTVVTREQADTAAAFRADGGSMRYINGVLRPSVAPVATPPSLDALRASALLRIDQAAETARLQFLTAGSGQALEYQATQAEAILATAAVGAGHALDAAAYPWLVAEQEALASIGQTATLAQIVTAVIATAQGWDHAGATIKRIRRAAKLQVGEAPTADAIASIVDMLAWPKPEAT